MSEKSPLFVSTLELLAHATELYADENSQKYKFVVLHLANAIELILKDCLLGNGISIYKNPKETITIWGAFDEIEKMGISIPEKHVLEILINDRNNIQHRFGSPTALATFYYLEHVISFFEGFLAEQYNTNLAEELKPYLSKENIALLGLVENDFNHFKKHFQASPQAAVLQACKTIEAEIEDFELQISKGYTLWTLPMPIIINYLHLDDLIKKGYLSDDMTNEIGGLRDARNQIPTPFASKTKVNWQSALDTAIEYLTALNRAKKEGVFDGVGKSN